LSKLNYILDTIAKKYANQLWLIRAILNDLLGKEQEFKMDLKRAYKYDRENTKNFIEKKEDVYLNVFP